MIQRKYNRMLRKEDGALHSRLSNPRDETSFKQTLDELNPVGPSRPMPQVRYVNEGLNIFIVCEWALISEHEVLF